MKCFQLDCRPAECPAHGMGQRMPAALEISKAQGSKYLQGEFQAPSRCFQSPLSRGSCYKVTQYKGPSKTIRAVLAKPRHRGQPRDHQNRPSWATLQPSGSTMRARDKCTLIVPPGARRSSSMGSTSQQTCYKAGAPINCRVP